MLWNRNQGKCGVCGDSVTDPTPRLHETGGKFGNKIITATYETGDIIDVEIVVNTNHLGFFEIKLCVVDDDSEETNECFDKHPLAVLAGPGSGQGQRGGGAGGGRVLVVSNITCRATGLRKDVTDLWCEDNCVLDLHNCPAQYCRCTIDVINEEEPVRGPEVSTQPTSPEQEEEEEEEEENVVCEAWSPGYREVPSISEFCRKSCLETLPAFCPPHICRCSASPARPPQPAELQAGRGEGRRCAAVGEFSEDPHMAQFCEISCSHPVPHCPPDLCRCRSTVITSRTLQSTILYLFSFLTSTPPSETTTSSSSTPWWRPSTTPRTTTSSSSSSTPWWQPSPTTTTSSHTTPYWWKFTAAPNQPVGPSPAVINLNQVRTV